MHISWHTPCGSWLASLHCSRKVTTFFTFSSCFSRSGSSRVMYLSLNAFRRMMFKMQVLQLAGVQAQILIMLEPWPVTNATLFRMPSLVPNPTPLYRQMCSILSSGRKSLNRNKTRPFSFHYHLRNIHNLFRLPSRYSLQSIRRSNER